MSERTASETASSLASDVPIRLSIISHVRFIRESLAEVLPRAGSLSISGVFANPCEALPSLKELRTHLVLFDEALPAGLAAVTAIRNAVPEIPIVVIGVTETVEEIVGWAEAGAAGYIPKTASLADIAPILADIKQGKQTCSPSVAGSLLRRISKSADLREEYRHKSSPQILTSREAEIAKLICMGMSNKEIARSLNIGIATTKTHVHHILGKLNLQRRGQAINWFHQQRELIL